MEVKIQTLTPLWTGDVDGKVDRIHETGILGSLRWWFEAIVRGLGGYACDTTQHTCSFDADKYRESEARDERQRLRDAGLCDVCQVFGATGWRRRFRLHIVETEVENARIAHTISLSNREHTDKKGKQRTPTWYFRDPTHSGGPPKPNTPKQGLFTIIIHPQTPDFNPQVIAGLIQLIADWAALGARAQMGFGVIELANGRIDTRPFYDQLIPVAGNRMYTDLPSLRHIFLARISPKDGASFREQDTFNLKYDLRRLFAGDRRLRHFIMGTVRGQRIAAKVKMSRPYGDGLMRVWGWIPEEAHVYQGSWNRDKVSSEIHKHLSTNYTLQVWREMNSPRDTVKPNNGDAQAFLQSLLSVKEREDAV